MRKAGSNSYFSFNSLMGAVSFTGSLSRISSTDPGNGLSQLSMTVDEQVRKRGQGTAFRWTLGFPTLGRVFYFQHDYNVTAHTGILRTELHRRLWRFALPVGPSLVWTSTNAGISPESREDYIRYLIFNSTTSSLLCISKCCAGTRAWCR